jgi:ATP-binding cassette, subfamily B, bacterial MsbA
MREYLKRVLELTRPYRFRLVLGLFCGFLGGALAFTLPVSLALAFNAVFPDQGGGTSSPAPEGITNSDASVSSTISVATNGSAAAGVSQAPAANQSKKPKSNLFSVLPKPIQERLDSLANWFQPGDRPSKGRLALVIALIPISMLIRTTLAYLNIYFLSWVGIRAANDLRVRLFRHLIDLPLGFFSKSSTGDLMTRVEGAMAVNSTVRDSFGTMIREPIQIVVLICTLVAMQPWLSLITLVVFPVCLIPIVVFGRKGRHSVHGVHSRFANISKVMHESFTGIRVIKGYNLESLVVEEFRQATKGLTSFFMRSVRSGELPGPLIEFAGSIGVAMVFAYFAFIPGEHKSPGVTIAFFFTVFSLYAPFKNLSRLHHQLTLARATVDPTYELLSQQTSLPEPAQPKPVNAHRAPIRFENVSFSYGEKTVLQNVNLAIQPGQMVALVGRTGSGKTTLANLLLRFYDPTTGAVRIGDDDIRSVSSRDLRSNIAVVTQETILFNDTIRHNIALGRPGATDPEIETAARHAYAHDFIVSKPKGYETLVGERGVNVSGGQRQRIAIARAIVRDAPILILDEATNALDTESERIVQTALEDLTRGRTTICIAHRLSTIQNADLIVVLDNGRIVETGTHKDLIASRGLYCKLYELDGRRE